MHCRLLIFLTSFFLAPCYSRELRPTVDITHLPSMQQRSAKLLIQAGFRPVKIKANRKLILERTATREKEHETAKQDRQRERVTLSPDGQPLKKQYRPVTKILVGLFMLYAGKKIFDIIGLTSVCQKYIYGKK